MKRRYLVRMNCEYTTVVLAKNPKAAKDLADRLDLDQWDDAWSESEVERLDQPDVKGECK